MNIDEAIRKTEYKYFGYYEMTEDQHEAVDVLVAAARENAALLTLLDRANETIRSQVDHDWSCPRSRDDYDCTCGLSELKHDMQDALE